MTDQSAVGDQQLRPAHLSPCHCRLTLRSSTPGRIDHAGHGHRTKQDPRRSERHETGWIVLPAAALEATVDDRSPKNHALVGGYEIDVRIPPSGVVDLVGAQQVWIGKGFAGRTVTLWADLASVHAIVDGEVVTTEVSRPPTSTG